MRPSGLVDRALARLRESDALGAVVGVHEIERDGLRVVRVEVSFQLPAGTRDGVDRALAGLPHEVLVVDRPLRGVVRDGRGVKDGREWRLGRQSDVDWIAAQTSSRPTIASAIPPVFEAYATIAFSGDDAQGQASDSALLDLLTERSPNQPWRLGYLDTGAHDVVFDLAPRVTLYTGWRYVVVEAGPAQAGTWRAYDAWRGQLPDLLWPADRSWLVSMLWDDDWRCLGGPRSLVERVLAEPALDARPVGLDEDATPPGHVCR